MSNIIRFPGMKPVNLDHIFTFKVEDWDIRFIPANPNNGDILWRFKSNADVWRVFESILYNYTNAVNVANMDSMDGNYED